MPELPKSKPCGAGFARVRRRDITRVEQRRADLRFPFPKDFAKRLIGAA